MGRTVGVRSDATDKDGHVAMVDIDGKPRPSELREVVRGVLATHGLRLAWLIETQKGWHVIYPEWMTWERSIAIHHAHDCLGADDMHRRASITRGAWVLRVTRRSPDDLLYRATVRARGGGPVSRVHQSVYVRLGVPPDGHVDRTAGVRLESW